MPAPARRLAAIMFTDLVRWSALTHRDERLGLALLEEHRNLLRTIFVASGGREVKTSGDGFLVEFGSALSATEAAIEIQRTLNQRNASQPPPPIEVRIGVHVGDVLPQDGDILGDAVNIASRIEPLAEAGGICLTGPVADQVANKIAYRLLPLEHAFLKNIDRPISVYEVDLPWHAPPAARITPWTDRATELDSLRRALTAIAQGNGKVLAIVGEAGIGKSRLAEEALQRAGPSAFRVLRARGFREVGDLPYSIWVETCLEYVRDAPDPLLYKVCANCATEMVQLLPQIAGRLGVVSTEPGAEPVSSQLRLFSGMVQFLQNVAREGPLVLLIDDLQWADPGSLRFLEYLAHHLKGHRLAVLATYRDSDAEEGGTLSEVLSELHRGRLVDLLSLKRFDDESASHLAGAILGTNAPPPEVSGPVLAKAGGNPFFVEELLRSLVEDGEITRSGENWKRVSTGEIEIPASIRDVVLRRVRQAGDETVEVLTVASVVGSAFRFPLLVRMAGLEAKPLLVLLERALRARLLRERETVPGEVVYEFADEQIRDILYAGLSRVRRQTYHLDVARALEALPNGGSPEAASELARHYRLGGALPQALQYAQAAAQHASSVFDHEGAVRSLEVALAARPEPDLEADLLGKLGDEWVALGHPDKTVEAWSTAIRILENRSARKRTAEMHVRLGYLQRQFFQQNASALSELHRARTILEAEGEGPELASLYLDLADLYWYDGQTSRAHEMCERALRLAERVGAHEVEGGVYLILAALAPPGEKHRAFEFLERSRTIGKENDLAEVFVQALHNLSIAHLDIRGDWKEAVRTLEEGIEYARKVRSVPFEMMLRARLLPYVLVSAGDLDRAEALAREMIAHTSRYSPTPEPLVLYVLGRVAAVRGRAQEAEEHLTQALEVLESSPDWSIRFYCLVTLAGLREARAGREAAAPFYREAQELGFKVGQSAIFGRSYSAMLLGLITSGLRANDVNWKEVEGWHKELRALVDAMDEDIGRAYANQAEGRLRWRRDGPGSAVELLETSVGLWTKLAWPIEQMGALGDLGELESARGNVSVALEMFAKAGRVASQLGASSSAEGFAARAAELQSGLPGIGTPPTKNDSSLE